MDTGDHFVRPMDSHAVPLQIQLAMHTEESFANGRRSRTAGHWPACPNPNSDVRNAHSRLRNGRMRTDYLQCQLLHILLSHVERDSGLSCDIRIAKRRTEGVVDLRHLLGSSSADVGLPR